MSRCIDADALECDTEWSEYHDGFISYSQMEIDSAPSIDIVRCKECKRCHYDDEKDLYRCTKSGMEHWMYKADIHYCDYGEREGE